MSSFDEAEWWDNTIAFASSEIRRFGSSSYSLGYGKPSWRSIFRKAPGYAGATSIVVAIMFWRGFAPQISIILFIGVAIYVYRVSEFSGNLKDGMTNYWGSAFFGLSALLVFTATIIVREGGSLAPLAVIGLIYLVVVACIPTSVILDHPCMWHEAYKLRFLFELEHICDRLNKDAKDVAERRQTELFNGHFTLKQDVLDAVRRGSCVKVPRHIKKLDLAEAWEYRDTQEISICLEFVNESICDRWNANIIRLDEYVQRRHLANEMAHEYIWRAKRILDGLGFDLNSIPIDRRPQVHGERQYIIPKSLQSGAVARNRQAILSGGARALTSAALGQANPILAFAVALTALVGAQVYDSRLLRRLKDAQGQLIVLAGSVERDEKLIDTLLITRYQPDMQRLAGAVKAIDGLADTMQRQVWSKQYVLPENVTTLAIAYLEGKSVLEIEEVIEK